MADSIAAPAAPATASPAAAPSDAANITAGGTPPAGTPAPAKANGAAGEPATPAAPATPGSLVGDAKAPVSAADQRAYLLTKAADDAGKKALEGKTDAEIAALYESAKKAEGEAKPAEVKPTEFKDFTLPEGVKADDALLTSFKGAASKAGLSQEQAQALISEFGGKFVPAAALKEAVDGPMKLWTDTQQKWLDEVKADKEIGGANIEPMKVAIAKAIDSLAGDKATAQKVRDAFNFTGAGNHPEIIRLLFRASKLVNEGQHVPGKPSGTGKSPASTLYPDAGTTPLGNANLTPG